MKLSKKTQMLAEGGIAVALALALSYLKIPLGVQLGGFGGSIDFVMVPLIVFAVRWGFGWGMLAGFAFGTLKYFVANGFAVSWVSIIFDYSVAYAFVGLAGLLKGKYDHMVDAALIGCVARFVIHFISGVTVYAEYMPEEFLGIGNMTPALYSLLYNGTYMLPNTVIALVVCALLIPVVKKLPKTEK